MVTESTSGFLATELRKITCNMYTLNAH